MFNIVRNNRGMSLIEVLVSGAMTIIISLGIASMMQNSFKEQRRVVLLDTLRNTKTRLETMVRDQAIWNATMTGNSGSVALFTALKAGTAATQVAQATPVKFKLYNADNTLAYDLLDTASTSGNGFTEKGGTCTTFNTTAGNDECPFSYRLLISAACATGASCTNPQLKVVARLVFNPSPTGSLANFVNLVSPIPGSSIADTIQDNKYDAVVKRTSTAVNRSFRIISGFIPPSGGCTAAGLGGAGICGGTPSTTQIVHPLTTGGTLNTGQWTDSANGAFDTYDLVNPTPGGGAGAFRFKETGYYGCLISVPAFATQGFQAYLMGGGVQIASSAVTAGLWVQATAVIDAKFNVQSVATDYTIEQKCDARPGGSPSADYCTLGFGSNYGASNYAAIVTMSCYKIDRSM